MVKKNSTIVYLQSLMMDSVLSLLENRFKGPHVGYEEVPT